MGLKSLVESTKETEWAIIKEPKRGCTVFLFFTTRSWLNRLRRHDSSLARVVPCVPNPHDDDKYFLLSMTHRLYIIIESNILYFTNLFIYVNKSQSTNLLL